MERKLHRTRYLFWQLAYQPNAMGTRDGSHRI
jgi:hypothetical protein